ncbi:MAG: oxygen-dependent coproporphyrinogen oxidase [Myxococcales bacterium]|nr:oxygen-dependent coproporphyrinogen oxidase [Myxococcales bacterium]MDP3503397.1 oxygen-dependent coproporphyrinogen oxidase [Myxococcales bacterium]
MRDVKPALETILNTIVDGLGALEGRPFLRDVWTKEPGGMLEGGGTTCILEGGALFERGGVAMSDVRGKALPPSATQRNPHLAGKGFHAQGVSLVMHPRNPNVPTAHLNVRSFSTDDGSAWWFGGGFDLTPYFYEVEDEAHWRAVSRATCQPYGGDAMYERMAADCDTYFTLKHRQERRGLGGIFFDDLNESHPFGGTFEHCFGFTQAVGLAFLEAYRPIVERRRTMPFTENDRAWQAHRRGRYVEFNLVWDRGTLFGLQSNGRTESILMSMPPGATWRYGEPELDARQRRLMERVRVSPTAPA